MSSNPRLQIDRAELIQTLNAINKIFTTASKAEAVLSFENGTLIIELQGMSVSLPASGEWPGRARIATGFLIMLAQVHQPTTPFRSLY